MKTLLTSLVVPLASLLLSLQPGPAHAADGYVAHEWGTFTSVQGADGVQLEWNPLSVAELPKFVHGGRPAAPGVLSLRKDSFTTLQRMETPVIYFYSDKEVTVDATVEFPQGLVTEWFPAATQKLSPTKTTPPQARRGIHWEDVQVYPSAQHAAMHRLLPADPSGSHYYAARDTDADYLQVRDETAARRPQVEKFLFYRGVGQFRAPLTVRQMADGEQLVLQNTGTEDLRDLFIYTVRGGRGNFVRLDRLAPNASQLTNLPAASLALSDLRAELGRQMRAGLVREGLYEREAAAMVQTWDDSWFAETGTRVLYTLPRAWTDRVLPLTLEPRPREVARVMVGRAELITPATEWGLTKLVARYCDGEEDEAGRARTVEEARALGLGRFMEAVTRRLDGRMQTREFTKASWALLTAASAPVPGSKPLAVK